MTDYTYLVSDKELQKFIDKYFTPEIDQHYYKESVLDKHRYLEALGNAFYKLACIIKASLMSNDDETILSTYSFLYHSFLSRLSLNINQFIAPKETLISHGFDLENDGVDTLKLKIFFTLLAKSSEHHFVSLMTNLISLLPEKNEVLPKNNQSKISSTLNDSHIYKEKRNNIWRNREKYNSLHSFFNIGLYKVDYQEFFDAKTKWQLANTWEVHKSLSAIGAFYIEYVRQLTIFEASKDRAVIHPSSLIFSSQATSNSNLITIFENNLIEKDDLVSTIKIDSTSTEHQIECMHSLYATGLLESLYRNKRRQPYDSKATKWLIEKLYNALCEKAIPLNSVFNSYAYNFNKSKYADIGTNKYLYIDDKSHALYQANKSSKNNKHFSHFKNNNTQEASLKSHKLKPLNNKITNIEEAHGALFQLQEAYANMTVSRLEKIWLNRSSEFNFTEEASIVLSLLRYNKGIDSHLLPYQHFNNQEMILELDLPSVFEVIDEPNREKESLKPDQEPNSNFKVTAEKETPINSDQKKELEHSPLKTNHESFIPSTDDERSFITATVAYRVGQSNFRAKLIEKWGCCNITGCRTVAALDAAHIIPYRGEKDNDIRNGLLLRADIHRLFDAYQIGIEPKSLKIHVSNLVDDPMYQAYHGKKLNIGSSNQISIAALKHHWSEFIAKNNIN